MDRLADQHASTHELTDLSADQWAEEGRDIQALPRADGGKGAWLFLTACFMLEALIWGFPFSFGVFQGALRSVACGRLSCMY